MSTHNTLCHGGWGNEVPRRRWRMKRYAVPMRYRAGTAPAFPRHCRIVVQLAMRVKLSRPHPLWHFLRRESRVFMKQNPAKEPSLCKRDLHQAMVSPHGSAKALSDHPAETFGPHPPEGLGRQALNLCRPFRQHIHPLLRAEAPQPNDRLDGFLRDGEQVHLPYR